jgi:hypothetical protein
MKLEFKIRILNHSFSLHLDVVYVLPEKITMHQNLVYRGTVAQTVFHYADFRSR